MDKRKKDKKERQTERSKCQMGLKLIRCEIIQHTLVSKGRERKKEKGVDKKKERKTALQKKQGKWIKKDRKKEVNVRWG